MHSIIWSLVNHLLHPGNLLCVYTVLGVVGETEDRRGGSLPQGAYEDYLPGKMKR